MKTLRFNIWNVIAGCVILVSTSCSGYLDENAKDQISEEKAYSTTGNLYLNTVATLYNYIGGNEESQGLQGTYRGVYDLNTFTTDEAIIPTRGGDWYDGGFWQGLFLHSWGVNNSALNNTWNYLYKVIALSNRSLEKLDEHSSLLTSSQLAAYKAEVRAFRAMYYYYLMDLFGNVPLVLSTSTSMNSVKQSSRSTVYNYIVSELQDVYPLLSTENSVKLGDYYGRVTRSVAFFLLAKLALNAEIYSDDDWTDSSKPSGNSIYFTVNGNKLNAWQTVEVYCDSISSLGYNLESDFSSNFAVYNENSCENIFVIPMDKNLFTNQMQNLFRTYHYKHAAAYGFTAENGSCATIEALKTFGYDTDTVDTRFAKSYYAGTVTDLSGNIVKLSTGENLVYTPWDVKLDLSGTSTMQTAGARMKKYAVDKTATKDGKLMDNDIVLFRFADVLLMRCEAMVRNGENGDAYLNRIRRRAGMTDRKATLHNILAERQLEFAWEGWRRQDLIRFGEYTRAYTDRPQLSGESNGYTTVFPIPANVMSLNSNLVQNSGYMTK